MVLLALHRLHKDPVYKINAIQRRLKPHDITAACELPLKSQFGEIDSTSEQLRCNYSNRQQSRITSKQHQTFISCLTTTTTTKSTCLANTARFPSMYIIFKKSNVQVPGWKQAWTEAAGLVLLYCPDSGRSTAALHLSHLCIQAGIGGCLQSQFPSSEANHAPAVCTLPAHSSSRPCPPPTSGQLLGFAHPAHVPHLASCHPPRLAIPTQRFETPAAHLQTSSVTATGPALSRPPMRKGNLFRSHRWSAKNYSAGLAQEGAALVATVRRWIN